MSSAGDKRKASTRRVVSSAPEEIAAKEPTSSNSSATMEDTQTKKSEYILENIHAMLGQVLTGMDALADTIYIRS